MPKRSKPSSPLLNDLGVAVYEQTPDAEALMLSTDNGPTAGDQ